MDNKVCLHCSKPINLKEEQYVQVSTINRVSKPDDHAYFHFTCWADYFNNCVLKKLKAQVGFMQESAMGLFNTPVMRELLGNIAGSDMALNMLKTPLKKDIDVVIKKEDIEEKIKDDRKKGNKDKKKM